MKIKFFANWCDSFSKPEIIGLKFKEIYSKNLTIFFKKLREWQFKKNELKDLEITIEYHYHKRTVDQNALMWWLYGILELETGTNKNLLYKNDILNYADRTEIKIKKEYLAYYKSQYRFIEKQKNIDNDHIYLKLIESSSHFNLIQMAKWINMLIIRLAEIGISNQYQLEIFDKLNTWQNYLNQEKVILYSNTTEEKYRKMHPLCECCFSYIGQNGQMAHIKSKGSGGSDMMYNRLHICNKCHIETQHKKGWSHIIKLYPHLEYKITKALKG